MKLSDQDIIVLSQHLASYNSLLRLKPGNKEIMRSTVENMISSGDGSFLISISVPNLRTLLLMGYDDLSDQIIQAIPRVKLKSFVASLSNIDFAEILYSISDVNNRKFLISFLSKIKSKRWNFIFNQDEKIASEFNKDLIRLKKHLESLQLVREKSSADIADLKNKSEEIKAANTELESIRSNYEAEFNSWKDKIAEATDDFKRSEAKRQLINKRINEREEALTLREKEISEENQRLLKQKVEQSLPGYIRKTQALLKAKERSFSRMGKNWSYVGVGSIIFAIYCGIFFTIYSFDFINLNGNLEWKYLLINLFKGSLVVGVFLYIAQHAFNISNAYVHESIQRSDKRHAINFGELFLKIYGSGLQREELLKVFANWNISTDSAFKKIPQASMHKELANLLSNFKPDSIGKEKKPDAD